MSAGRALIVGVDGPRLRCSIPPSPAGSSAIWRRQTIAAFLAAIEGLVEEALEGRLADGTQIIHVSPLKVVLNVRD
jgi:hypothetical protein